MTTRYRNAELNGNSAVFIGRSLLETLLAQEGAKGIRFYFGLNEQKQLTLVLAAANAEGADMTNKVGNRGSLCPPNGDPLSLLCQ